MMNQSDLIKQLQKEVKQLKKRLALSKEKKVDRDDHHRIESPGLSKIEDEDYESGNGM